MSDGKGKKAVMRGLYGMTCVILSAILFGLMPFFTKTAYGYGSNAYTVAFGRFFFGSLMLGTILSIYPKQHIIVQRKNWGDILWMGIFYAATPLLLFQSYNYMDSGIATILHFSYPVAVILLMWIFWNKRLNKLQWICCVLCAGGMLCFYTPGAAMSFYGSAMALLSGVFYAAYIVLLGQSAIRNMSPMLMTFWISVISSVVLGALALLKGELIWKMSVEGWEAEILLAFSSTVLAVSLFQKGLMLCGEVKASLLSTFEPLTSIVIGIVVFHELLTFHTIVGICCISLAVLLLILTAKTEKNFNSEEGIKK